jgi:leukotriene-A4 hydrolase
LLAGDKSLAAVIAHEIAHSWTGNLVTNCTWEHFWLNEGWTVWLERKIMSRVKKDINHLKMSSQLGWTALAGDSKWSQDARLIVFCIGLSSFLLHCDV